MSWRYKYYKRKSHSNYRSYEPPKFFYKKKEINFSTERLDYQQFFLQQFFSKELDEQEELVKFYSEKFGNSSLSYLRRKYSEWKDRNFHLTDLMRERIVEIMPYFLDEDARHILGRYEFMTLIKTTVKSHSSNQNNNFRVRNTLVRATEIVKVFEDWVESIDKISHGNTKFIVLSKEEKNEAIDISKYILETKLQVSFEQIKRDFEVFTPLISEIEIGLDTATYTINDLNITIDLTKLDVENIEFPNFELVEVEGNSEFQIYSDKYLAYELLTINTGKNRAVTNSFLNTTDVNLFLDHCDRLLNGDSEAELKSEFIGEGGKLNLKMKIVPEKALKNSIAFSAFKMILFIFVLIAIVNWLINIKAWFFLVLGVLVFGISILTMIKESVKHLKKSFKDLNQLKNYGK